MKGSALRPSELKAVSSPEPQKAPALWKTVATCLCLGRWPQKGDSGSQCTWPGEQHPAPCPQPQSCSSLLAMPNQELEDARSRHMAHSIHSQGTVRVKCPT